MSKQVGGWFRKLMETSKHNTDRIERLVSRILNHKESTMSQKKAALRYLHKSLGIEEKVTEEDIKAYLEGH